MFFIFNLKTKDQATNMSTSATATTVMSDAEALADLHARLAVTDTAGMSPTAAANYNLCMEAYNDGNADAAVATREAIFDAFMSGVYKVRNLRDDEADALGPRYYGLDDEGKETVRVPKAYAQKWEARRAAAAKAAAPPVEKKRRARPMSNAETRAAFAAAGPCFVKPGEAPVKLPRVPVPAAAADAPAPKRRAASPSEGEKEAYEQARLALRWYATVRAERGWNFSGEINEKPDYDAAHAAAREALESLVQRLDADHSV